MKMPQIDIHNIKDDDDDGDEQQKKIKKLAQQFNKFKDQNDN
jgi:hypothetical protein